uniref:RRM domain-containing protein n=1 Tax=Cyprinus carpio TaxID=7962 RepID=A0A8C1NV80_CYPCA
MLFFLTFYSSKNLEKKTKVYVGNLGTGAGKGELERAFSYYGPLRTLWIARNPPGFAFVEFEDPRDAEVRLTNAVSDQYLC